MQGHSTNLNNSSARAFCACTGAGKGYLGIFFSSHLLFLFSNSLSVGHG